MFALLRSLRLASRISLSLTLFLVPLALVLFLLISAQQKDIVFASREVAGARVLASLDAAQMAAEQAMSGNVSPLHGTSLDDAADQLAMLNLVAPGIALSQAVHTAATPDEVAHARAALRTLQAQAGDHSNLILDNVLDSYYLTDVVLNRIPELLDRLADVGPLAAHQASAPQARADFLMMVGGLSAVLDGLDGSLHSAMSDNPSGQLTAALSSEYETLHAMLVDFAKRLQDKSDASGAGPLLERTSAFMQRADVELRDMLIARVSHLARLRNVAVGASLLLFAVASAFTLLIVFKGVVRPMAALCAATRRLAEGDLETATPAAFGRDEVSELARDIAAFRDKLIAKRDLEADQAQIEQIRSVNYVAAGELARDFNEAMSGRLARMGEALDQLRGIAEALASRAETTNREAAQVGDSTAVANRNTQTVAAASEELAASSREIACAIQRSTVASQQMQVQAQQATEVVGELTEVAQGMISMIGLVSSIARQTNLLALNATIEAARAGEAGRGFAVVASEVKTLAGETASATEDIGKRVAAVRSSAQRAAELMSQITSQVSTVEGTAGAIAAAVTEQGAATEEISRNVQETANCMVTVAEGMDGLSRNTDATKESSAAMLQAFRHLAGQASELHDEVKTFLEANTKVSDRRSYARHKASDSIVLTTADGTRLNLQLRDLGEGGFAASCDAALTSGEAVSITGLGARPLNARVVSCARGQLRGQFRFDVETQAALRQIAELRFAPNAQLAA